MKIPLAEFRSRDRNREFAACYRENLDLWPVPYREKRVKTSFGETHVIISGKRENPPAVLLHGFSNTPLMWRYSAESLARDYCLYMPETLGDAGLGRSDQLVFHPGQWTDWLEELLNSLELDAVRLGGFSLGGWHAARFALAHPERIRSLALLSPVPLFRMIPVSLFREAVAVILAGKKPAIRRLIGKQYAAQNFPDKTYERLLFAVITGFLPELPLFPRELSREEWTRLPDQTLIITGEEEIYFDPGDAREIAAKYRPDIPFVLLEETGHSVSMEMPEQVNDTLLAFWSGTVPN
ncbi:MAG: alpha/beta hydrolase [Spirochaetales bacterium]|nr:alpha/beta hydrolase [Spirochaetales bacterium]